MVKKYRFKDRAGAENALAVKEAENHILIRAIRAIERKEIQWFKRRGNYQLGVFDSESPCGARCVVRDWLNEKVDTRAYDFESWAGQFANCIYGDEYDDIRAMIQEARQYLYGVTHDDPGLNEEDHAKRLAAARGEAWLNYVAKDFAAGCEERFRVELGDVSRELFDAISKRAGIEWTEDGIDASAVARFAEYDELPVITHTVEYNNPDVVLEVYDNAVLADCRAEMLRTEGVYAFVR